MTMKKIPFMKFSGAGNDFIVVDNRDRVVDPGKAPAFVAHVCKHHLSVGADGLILIEKSRKTNFRWRFYNDDGGEADFCGNGARCAARFAYLKRIAPKVMRFDGAAGVVEAEVTGDQVTVRVPDPAGVRLNLHLPVGPAILEGHAVNTGVPHVVYFVPETATAEVLGVGRATRYHDEFKPAGTNVNFVQVLDRHTIHVRTYERGVEDETLACGSGAIASALIAGLVHKVESPVTVVPISQMPLRVTFRSEGERFTDVTLTGDARAVYEGVMRPDAWEYELP
jgi:diaminopimelate epimerase